MYIISCVSGSRGDSKVRWPCLSSSNGTESNLMDNSSLIKNTYIARRVACPQSQGRLLRCSPCIGKHRPGGGQLCPGSWKNLGSAYGLGCPPETRSETFTQ